MPPIGVEKDIAQNTWKHCSTEMRFVLFDAELTSKSKENVSSYLSCK